MAFIHHTATVVPSKLELLADWLPNQAWYAGRGGPGRLSRAGGFRLDDPAGEVGIECFFVADEAAGDGTTYLVPMSYRGAPLPRAESALISTAEHSALGPRWVYDGTHDPVVMDALTALFEGRAEPQHQTESDTVDTTVRVHRSRNAIAASRIEVVRVLVPRTPSARPDAYVEASWRRPDGSEARGVVIAAR